LAAQTTICAGRKVAMNTQIRALNEADAAAYQSIRRQALLEHPEAYGATVREFDRRTLDEIAASLAPKPGLQCMFGAFVEDELSGLASFYRSDNEKLRHRAGLYQMYTVPDFRRLGLGRQLVDAVIEYAQGVEGLEELILAVTIGNPAAEHLYLQTGFRPKYVDSGYMKIGSTYYDILWMSRTLQQRAG
jgi:RimJ/RimL family protein N-acetyltransferase